MDILNNERYQPRGKPRTLSSAASGGVLDPKGNKCALITGGASGIGRATVELFAKEGAAVVVADINTELGKQVEREIQQAGGRAVFVACDVTRAEDCQRAVQTAVERFGRLDILFNNAGIVRRADVLGTTEAEWDRVMDVNVKSIFLMSKFAVPVMAKQGGGSIVNMGSGWGIKGGRNAVSYCASKGAVVNMTRAMAIDTCFEAPPEYREVQPEHFVACYRVEAG